MFWDTVITRADISAYDQDAKVKVRRSCGFSFWWQSQKGKQGYEQATDLDHRPQGLEMQVLSKSCHVVVIINIL